MTVMMMTAIKPSDPEILRRRRGRESETAAGSTNDPVNGRQAYRSELGPRPENDRWVTIVPEQNSTAEDDFPPARSSAGPARSSWPARSDRRWFEPHQGTWLPCCGTLAPACPWGIPSVSLPISFILGLTTRRTVLAFPERIISAYA